MTQIGLMVPKANLCAENVNRRVLTSGIRDHFKTYHTPISRVGVKKSPAWVTGILSSV